MAVAVYELLNCHFSLRPFQEQLNIIAMGPPRPRLRSEWFGERNGEGNYLDKCIYDLEMWLCGCNITNRIYCWTCLLFLKKEVQWCVFAISRDRDTIRDNVSAHKNTPNHIRGMLKYHIFRSQSQPIAPQNVEEDKLFEKNREILERIIDTVCMMVSQMSPTMLANGFSLHSHYVKLFNLHKIYDDPEMVEETCNFTRDNPRIFSDIVESLASLIKRNVKKELKSATAVSIILSAHTEVKSNLLLSIVVRYAKNGQVNERLIGYSSTDCFNTDFFQLLIDELGISENFLALSCDGVVLPTRLLDEFLGWLQVKYPRVLFIPCHFHEFHSVLQQAISSDFPECYIFFGTLRSIKVFFASKPSMCWLLHDFCTGLVYDISNLKLSDTQFLRFVKLYRRGIIGFFKYISEDFRTADYGVLEVLAFIKCLEDCQTVFFLEMFFLLFEQTGFLNEMLGSKSPDSAFESGVIDGTLDSLKNLQQYQFVNVCAQKIADMEVNFEVKEVRGRFSELFESIVIYVIETVELRFKFAKSLNFLGIFDFENRNRFFVSDYHFYNLPAFDYKFISIQQLATELKVMRDSCFMITGGMSVYEVVEYLHQKNLSGIFKNFSRLAEFIVSMPCKPLMHPFSNRCMLRTKLDSLNAWASSSAQTLENENMRFLCVEKNYLEYLNSLTIFYDQVVSELRLLLNKPK